MHKIIVEETTSIPVDQVWKLLTDIKNYPKYIRFVTKIKTLDNFEEGFFWSDITNIFWIHLEIKHQIIKIERNKKLIYRLFLPIGGKMTEECELIVDKNGTKINVTAKFTFNNYFLDLVIGNILKIRIKKMLLDTMRNFKKLHDPQGIT